MLKLDVKGLSEEELAEAVFYHCSQFGNVARVKLVRPSYERSTSYAVVLMREPGQLERLSLALGDYIAGESVLIRLEQEDARPQPHAVAQAVAEARG